jgi:hypothetical protein
VHSRPRLHSRVQPHPDFLNLSPTFWANVRTISQALGYTDRSTKRIQVHSPAQIIAAYDRLGLAVEHLFNRRTGRSTDMGQALIDYFAFRADVLESIAEPNLMDYDEARELFYELFDHFQPQRPFSMNKQKGDKAGPALLTGIVSMILESKVGDDCDYDPRILTTVTRSGLPVRTLARRVDGAFPAIVNPTAIWEIKEYYHTTTFGSRIADGVYETMLDGLELAELRNEEGIDIRHYLFVDSHRTWWGMGRSYLCRMVDILHMGLVDEILFGREVVSRLPDLIDEWVEARRDGASQDHAGTPAQLHD